MNILREIVYRFRHLTGWVRWRLDHGDKDMDLDLAEYTNWHATNTNHLEIQLAMTAAIIEFKTTRP